MMICKPRVGGMNQRVLARRSHLGWARWLSLGLLLLLPVLVRAEAVPDVRVLIDISGSMKKNDPKNLRASALRMLVGLMPDGTRSGVWTFGQYVNMMVKLGKVDKAWKQKAMAAASKISSDGLYTNIEEAVKKATVDWTRPDPKYRRNLILLTDGMVDVSKDKARNAASRRRLLQKVLPRLEAADVTIHTIALSPNADKELLSTLAGATKGAFVQVDNANSLQRIFLKLFEKSVAPDALPLKNNKFKVDKHVSDFTVLVFLAKDSPPTRLITPSGKTWSQKAHPKNVSWFHDPGYDLITVQAPQPGGWQLQAKLDPDNRVMIVTNLRLKVDRLPNTLLLGDKFDVRARLLENGKSVTNERLLSKTRFTLEEEQNGEVIHQLPLKDDGVAPDVLKDDGVYSARVPAQNKAGAFDLVIAADSLTFKRQLHHTLQVHASPAVYQVTQPGPNQPLKLDVHPHAGLIRPETVSMQITLPDGQSHILNQVGDLDWQASVPASLANKHVSLTIVGKRYNDQDLKMKFDLAMTVTTKPQPLSLKPAAISLPKKPAKAAPAATASQGTEHKDKADKPGSSKKQDKNKTGNKVKAKARKGFNWTTVIIMVIVVNLIVILGGWLGYRVWQKKKAKALQDVEAGTKA